MPLQEYTFLDAKKSALGSGESEFCDGRAGHGKGGPKSRVVEGNCPPGTANMRKNDPPGLGDALSFRIPSYDPPVRQLG
jgi:hypothetical protein